MAMNFIIYLYAQNLEKKGLNILANTTWIDQISTNSTKSSAQSILEFIKKCFYQLLINNFVLREL